MNSSRVQARLWVMALVGTLLVWLVAQGPGAGAAARTGRLFQTIPTRTPEGPTDQPPTTESPDPGDTDEPTDQPTDAPPIPSSTATQTASPSPLPSPTDTLAPGAPTPTDAPPATDAPTPEPSPEPTSPLPGGPTNAPTSAPSATVASPAPGEATPTAETAEQTVSPSPAVSPTRLHVPTPARPGITPEAGGIGGPGGLNLYCLWVTAGLVLVAAGVALLVWRSRSSGTEQ